MTEQPTEKPGLPDLPKGIALVVLAGISAFIVWLFNNADWPACVASLIIGGFFGFLAGGLVGVHLFPTLGAMVAFGVIGEGIMLGHSFYGWVGAILGALLGVVGAIAAVTLPLMLIHLILIICGIDPFTTHDRVEDKKTEAPK